MKLKAGTKMNKRHGMNKGTLVAVLVMGLAIPVSSAVAQEMGLFPVRVAPFGSLPGTPGNPVTVQFNAALDCWELPVLSGGAEVHFDVQVFGWGDAPDNPTLFAYQATVDSSGYSNGIGADLNPKGWPDNPGRGFYQTTCFCSDNEVPCLPPFNTTCDAGYAGVCVQNPDFLRITDPPQDCPYSGTTSPITLTLGYTWFGGFFQDPLVDDGRMTTVAGLILEVPPDAAGTYVVGLDPNPSLSFLSEPSAAHIPGLQFIRTCITIVEERPCCLPDGSCTQLLPEDCAIGGGIVGCECRGDDDMNGVNDACEADCDGDGTLDVVEFADCPPGDLSCGDCNFNCEPDGCEPDADGDGVPDDCDNCPDAPNPGQEDKNGDRLGDACAGACCFVLDGLFSCLNATEAYCAGLPDVSGDLQKLGTVCPTEGVSPQFYTGPEGVQIVWPAQVCGGGHPAAECIPGDPIDPWESPPGTTMYHNFNWGDSPPIPADFFGPGSDQWPGPKPHPTNGRVALKPEPLGPTVWGEFGEAHMLVRRTGGPAGTGDPFDRCELTSANAITVDAEVIALSVVSTEPIIVTYNGGQNPESWDVVMDLSEVTPELGWITAVKTHCNGGTYDSELHVQPRFTFSEVGGSGTAVLDTGLEGIPFITLALANSSIDTHWTSDVSETLGLPSPICTDFHPGIEDTEPSTECDCNVNAINDTCDPDCQPNNVPDDCDIASGASGDLNGNGVPDECEIRAPILAPSPHHIRKNRYISIDPRGAMGINPDAHHIRVTLDSTEVLGVDASQVGSVWWANAPDANCISILGRTQPVSEPDWSACPTLHLTGCPIIPTSTYAIVTVSGGLVSSALVTETQLLPADNKWWGDSVGIFTGTEWTEPQGVANFDDVNACLRTFIDPNAVNATHTTISDVHPNRPDLGGLSVHPNKLVSIDDTFQFIQAFQGAEYPGGDLAGCTDP